MSERGPTIAVTGADGRLGTALVSLLGPRARPWSRPAFDLDRPDSAVELLTRDRPDLVIHAAAMTDVDACAREPELAMRRNGEAVGALAETCRSAGCDLVVLSTNEVFDGERTDGVAYVESDEPGPRNPYGASKLAGERAAAAAYEDEAGLWIVRTAWLYGHPGAGFPEKIVRAADGLEPGVPLPIVADEHGSPTLAADLAAAILALTGRTGGGTFHLVDEGRASRLEWGQRVLARLRPERATRPISQAEFERASDPPAWGVLDGAKAAAAGVPMRSWEAALDDHLERMAAA